MSDTTIKQNYITINGWSITSTDDAYTPPEFRTISLHGAVSGHPNFPDGSKITTSPVVKAESRVITTRSGKVYMLGEVDPGYLTYLLSIGREYNHESPIRVVTM